ncbi:MATE family efflux transporter [Victivallis sp. Marseille-Q1083]|uniref:MATE family efflux transporter n=1 Tax=Victivallis sp. Marseille-Q1083 TaxID=2717288 RepID=UPI001589936E|nr:MATE family efflux transporter [Victivallis sp. Marseille-Q1083]
MKSGETDIRSEFARYVSLNLFGMVGLSLYILADTFFVARGVGRDGLAALNLAIPVFSLISGIGLMIGIGGAAHFSILRGSGRKRTADAVFSGAVKLAVLFSLLFVMIGIFWTERLAQWLGADRTLQPLTIPYIRTLLLFAPAFLGNNLLIAFVRNDGGPRLAMIAMLVGSAANIVLDYLFLFPFGWGMFGAALATGLAPVIGLAILSFHPLPGRNRFHWGSPGFLPEAAGKILVLGMPSFITEFSSGVVMLLFNWTILKLAGNLGVAAYGVIANIALIAVAAFSGVGQGIQPLVSRAHGAGHHEKSRTVLLLALCLALLIGAGLYLILACFPDAVIGIFNREGDEGLQEIARQGTYLYFIALLFMGGNIVAVSFFTAIGRSLPPLLISFLRGPGIIVPILLIFPYFWGLTGVWLVIPAAESATWLLTAALLLKRCHARTGGLAA